MQLINALNPVVAGWSNYFSTVVRELRTNKVPELEGEWVDGWMSGGTLFSSKSLSTDTYSMLDHWLYAQLNHWASHRHPHKNQRWIANKYWLIDQGQGWTFAAKTPDSIVRLARHNTTAIKRHVKVQGKRSPYDADWVYWSSRMAASSS